MLLSNLRIQFLKLLFSCLCFFTFSHHPVSAQQFLAPSTFGGGNTTHAMYLNPANAANKSNRIQLHIASAGMDLHNDYVKYAANFSMLDLIRGKNDQPLSVDDLIEIQDKSNPLKKGTLSTEIRGPAISFPISSRTHLSLLSRVRSAVQVSDASPEFLTVVRLGLGNFENYQKMGFAALNAASINNQFKTVSQAYSEWGLSIAHTLIETDNSRVNIGGTVKRFFAYGGGYINTHNLRYSIRQSEEDPNQLYMNVDQLKADVGYVTNNSDKFVSFKWLFGNNAPGKGWGADIGINYEFWGDNDQQSKPKFKLGLALVDIGTIKYDSPQVNRYTIDDTNKMIDESTWQSFTNNQEGESIFSSVSRQLTEQFNLANGIEQTPFKMGIPTSLTIHGDIQVAGPIYVSGVIQRGIYGKDNLAWRQTSITSIIPRLEGRTISVAVPILWVNGATGVGVAVKAGPFMVGSDNLTGFFARNGSSKAQGVNVYGGLSFNLGK